jgi:transposase
MVDTFLAGSLSDRRRYRRWSAEAKRAICLETRAPGVSVAQVAQLHSLNANLIFKWLRDARFAPGGMLEAAPVFLPVQLRAGEAPRALSMVASEGSSSSSSGRVEIVLADGHRLTASGAFDGDAVSRLLAVLVRA